VEETAGITSEVNMAAATHIASPAPYASSDDFGRIFSEEMDELYQLSFLLIGDHEKAEQCFVSGLEDSVNGNRVFKEWARSWARRAIIQCAVRVVNPRPMEEGDPLISNGGRDRWASEREETVAILGLRPFERFVFVMSVLERYSDQDCSVLLGCARRDVVAARLRAFQQLDTQSNFALSGR
jgi:DNA-directed RNA polymerase specialized sigma24 family protein